MRGWFSKIQNRDDALKVIKTASNVFFVLAGLLVAISASLIWMGASSNPYARIGAMVLDMLFTASLFAVFASVLRQWNSRIAAVALLLLATISMAMTFATNAGVALGGKNIVLAAVAVWAGVRATQATFKLHGRFAQGPAPQAQNAPRSTPNVDFVSHPAGGMKSTAATADAKSRSEKPYDKEKWAALLKYDDDIARLAERIRPLGNKWLDELARAYLVLNDKQYLRRIEEKIIADARAEAVRSRL